MGYTKAQVERALRSTGYHHLSGEKKVDSFLFRCSVESDSDNNFPRDVLRDVAYGMLDADLEKDFFNYLDKFIIIKCKE